MKKVLSTKKITMFLILLIIVIGTRVFATDSILGNSSTDSKNTAIQITPNDIEGAQTIQQDPNYANTAGSNVVSTGTNTSNSASSNNTSNGINTSSQYNTVDEDKKDLPQTGIEDHNIGILLIVFIAAAIYAYKKMKDYKNV